MSQQTVTMVMLHYGSPRDRQARDELAEALPDAHVSEPDETGIFEIELEAGDQEQALERVWDAVAESGTDDHIAFLEHPDLPEHWRDKSSAPSDG